MLGTFAGGVVGLPIADGGLRINFGGVVLAILGPGNFVVGCGACAQTCAADKARINSKLAVLPDV
jgi:hypothetical protein